MTPFWKLNEFCNIFYTNWKFFLFLSFNITSLCTSDLTFFAQVKMLFEMLIKKCGLEAVKEVMPEEHVKLLTNIRKVCWRLPEEKCFWKAWSGTFIILWSCRLRSTRKGNLLPTPRNPDLISQKLLHPGFSFFHLCEPLSLEACWYYSVSVQNRH